MSEAGAAAAEAGGVDVFISYARENRPVAEQLAEALAAGSLRVWWDREIRGGTQFAEVIEGQLTGARVVIVLWSAVSVRSSYVRDESERALRAGKLLPVRIEDVELPLGFGQTHTLDLIDWDGDADDENLQAVLQEVRQRRGQPLPAPVERPRISRRKWWPYAAAVALLVLAAGAAYFVKTAVDRGDADDLVARGLERQYAKEPNIESARNDYVSALHLRPDHARAHYYLAHVYVQLGESDAALDEFKLALDHQDTLDQLQRRDAKKQLTALSAPGEPKAVERKETSSPPQPPPPPPVEGKDKLTGIKPPPPPPPPGKPTGTLPRVELDAQALVALEAPVNALFDDNKQARITATTSLIVNPEQLSDAVPLAIAKARSLLRGPAGSVTPTAASGVVNTLVVLQQALPGTLNAHRAAIEDLLGAASPIGEYTREQAGKVSNSLKDAATRRPRIYFQIADEAQRALANAVAAQYRSAGYEVPGFEVVGNRAPTGTEVRVQGLSDRGYARWLAKAMAETADVAPKITTLRGAKPKNDTYEIWLEQKLCVPSGRQVAACAGAATAGK